MAAVEEERGVVASVELDEVVTADYAAGVVGHGDNEVEDDVVCEKFEEVVSVGETLQACSMMRKNGSKARKSSMSRINDTPPHCGGRWSRAPRQVTATGCRYSR